MDEGDPNLVSGRGYGISKWRELFTPRQLTAMVTLSDLVRGDAERAGLSPAKADAYAATVVTFLALALDRCADFNNALCRWTQGNQKVMNLFGRQAIPMVWDFAEANTLGESVGAWATCCGYVAECIETLAAVGTTGLPGHARPLDAASPWDGLKNVLVSTDPPYYDNIGYAALSDFFYVWLRRTIGDLYPDLFGTILVPKEPELVAAPERFDGDRHKAREHFEDGFRRAFAALREKMDSRFPLTVYYAFKQDDEESGADEEEANGGNGNGNRVDRTTGWETMLEASSEPVSRSPPPGRCGRRRSGAWFPWAPTRWPPTSSSPAVPGRRTPPQTDRRSFVAELKRELPSALKKLQQGNIAPVDFAQAAIGPGMAIYSKYRRILEASGRPMSVRTALALINQTLTEVLSEQEDEFDNDTRWAIAWFEQHGFEEGEYGQAELLSKAKVMSVRGLEEGGSYAPGAARCGSLGPRNSRRIGTRSGTAGPRCGR